MGNAMNPLLEPVRQAILTELSGLSYTERRRLQDSFDVEFVTAELAKIEKRARWYNLLVALTMGVFALALGLLLYRDLGGSAGVVICLAAAMNMLILLDYHRRRRVLYRVLAALATADGELRGAASPGEAE